jgi:hypothetical protein
MLLLSMTLGANQIAFAQTDEDHFQTFPFNFSNPGARSTAMGGAFIGVADDASAAVTNPAGLTSLTRKQVYLEYKSLAAPVGQMSLSTSLVDGRGTLVGPRMNLPGFINFAMPVNDKVTVAFSSHQFLSYRNDFDLQPRRTIGISSNVFPRTQTPVDFKGFSFSGAVGLVVSPKVRVGAAASLNRLSASLDANRLVTPGTAAIPSTEIHDTSFAPGVTGGLLYQATDKLAVGALYAYEPHFKVSEQMKAGELARLPQPAQNAWRQDENGWTIPFNIPPRVGLGVSYRPKDWILAVFDVNYVQYSTFGKFSDDQLVLFRHVESFAAFPVVAADSFNARQVANPADFHIDNGFNYQGGAEFQLVRGQNPVYLRYGAQRIAPHAVIYGNTCAASNPLQHQSDFVAGGTSGPLEQERQKAFGRPRTDCNIVGQYYFAARNSAFGPSDNDRIVLGKAEVGVTLGGGIAIGRVTQIDIAYLRTTYKRQEFVISSAVRF